MCDAGCVASLSGLKAIGQSRNACVEISSATKTITAAAIRVAPETAPAK
jgi:hypothetical protein